MDLLGEIYPEVDHAIRSSQKNGATDLDRLGGFTRNVAGAVVKPIFPSIWAFLRTYRDAGGNIPLPDTGNTSDNERMALQDPVLVLVRWSPDKSVLSLAELIIKDKKDRKPVRRTEVEVMMEDIIANVSDSYFTKDAQGNSKQKPDRIPTLSTRALMRFLTQKLKESLAPSSCRMPKEDVEGSKVTFATIFGAERAINQIRLGYIFPIRYVGLFAKVKTRGMLLYGPPGTGKTEIVRALINELKDQRVALFSITGGDLKGSLVGQTEKNIKAAFDCASAVLNAPDSKYTFSIIFIDEFDAVGGKRGGEDVNMALSVNALLQAMDGVDTSPNVSVIAATNRPDKLDTAILSRISTRVFMDLPNYEARNQLLLNGLGDFYAPPKQGFPLIPTPANASAALFQLKPPQLYYIEKYGTYYDSQQRKMVPSLTVADIKFLCQKIGPKPPTERVPLSGDEEEDKQNKIPLKLPTTAAEVDWQLIFAAKQHPPREGDPVRPLLSMRDDDMQVEFSNEASSLYGYSGREIRKVLSQAVTLAAIDAVNEKLSDYVPVLDDKKMATGYWVYVKAFAPGEKPELARKLIDLRKPLNEGGVGITDTSKILNFTITREHFLRAIQMNPSTIDGEEYVDLLRYNSEVALAKREQKLKAKREEREQKPSSSGATES